MKLHLDKDSFEAILLEVEQISGIRADILEKDYYVTLLLKELAGYQSELKAYFKGGTALYKALGSIRRFSEDIDLTVAVDDGTSRTQAEKRLKKSAKGYTGLQMIEGESEEKRGSCTAVYKYYSIVSIDRLDALQRFERVKIEATSFTVSESTEPIVIAPKIFEIADDDRKKILSEVFSVKPFEIMTIKLERIFIDKIFASEYYYTRKMLFDTAKHIYDISVLFNIDRIKNFIEKVDFVHAIVALKRSEEKERHGGVPEDRSIKDFSYFEHLHNDNDFLTEFKKMQSVYVFDEKDVISFSRASETIKKLNKVFLSLEI